MSRSPGSATRLTAGARVRDGEVGVHDDLPRERGLIVLSYTAARTSVKDRPRYEAELAKIS